ncbi:MAG: hypothetical protein AcusKO_07380 [Acuticoccus sp.]
MRWFYTLVVIVILAVIVIFAFQNLGPVSVQFLSVSLELPIAVFTIAIYLIGMVTGSSLIGMVRTSYRKSRPSQH